MKEKIFAAYYPILILVSTMMILASCQDSESLKEIPAEEILPKGFDTEIIGYDDTNELVPDEYIVLIKSVSQSGLYPELDSRKKSLAESEREDSESGFQEFSKANNSTQSRENLVTAATFMAEKHGMSKKNIRKVFNGATPGFLMNMTASQAQSLKSDPDVEMVEQDRIIALEVNPLLKTPFIPSDIDMDVRHVPYGVERVGGSVNFEQHRDWKNRWVWILDTGIDTDHPDLHVLTSYSIDCTSENTFDDAHGHGTHVAGIVAAKDNSFGVTGVVAGAKLVAVKVLNSKGTGKYSELLAGLSHVMQYAQADDVVNISLGGNKSETVDKAVLQLGMRGIHVVMASGNSGKDMKDTSPASTDGYKLYTVGAIDWEDTFTDYSNYGTGLDFAAPGHGILSTYLDGKYAYTSGTSMAAPHAAGVILLTKGIFRSSSFTWTPGGYVPIISH